MGASLDNLAVILQAAGDYEQAEALYIRGLANHEEALGPDHPDVAIPLLGLAEVRLAVGKADEAEALFSRAHAIREKALGPDHPDVAHALVGLADVALEQHRPDEAAPLAQRAVALREKSGVSAELLAQARFALARALWDARAEDGRDRARARALAEQARDAYRAAGKYHANALATTEDWLATHAGGAPPGR